ncbi:MAG: hypothetical protein DMD75_02050 [Candidatus Rokuibacteriota bacterium]|nr:MAG: hypothetical protein DMD75_02050 [Candidatus Rokubacteria bacterium]
MSLKPRDEVDREAARRDVAKKLGVKPNDPMVDKVLTETIGVEASSTPIPTAKVRPEAPPAEWKQDRAAARFIEATKAAKGVLGKAVLAYLAGCPKGLDQEKKEYRLFPERELTRMFTQLLSWLGKQREWVRSAEWNNGQWEPPVPRSEAAQ